MAKELEISIIKETNSFENQLKKLLSKKDKLVSQKGKGNRNQYQIEIQKLKDKMKSYKKAGGKGFTSFKKLLGSVKKDEREGKFDRGAEGKTKKKLRAKMAKTPEALFTSGRHKESEAAKKIEESGIKELSSKSKAAVSRNLAGLPEKKKKVNIGKSR